jgi:hypothetical protein
MVERNPTMKSLAALTLLLCLAAPVEAQIGGGLYSGNTVAVGPWQPSAYYPGYTYYNPSGYVPYYGGYGGSYRTYLQEESLYELRRIRQLEEDRAWRRSWRR